MIIFVYVYCFYYYFIRSDMSGLMQTSFFFGYNAVVCYAFFLMLGSVGFSSSQLFVRHIYRSVGRCRGTGRRRGVLCPTLPVSVSCSGPSSANEAQRDEAEGETGSCGSS